MSAQSDNMNRMRSFFQEFSDAFLSDDNRRVYEAHRQGL